jgi:hypothetical protein
VTEPNHPDDLFSLPLEEFISARDQMASRLATEGKDEEAALVAKFRKPSIAAWALNRAARNHPDAVRRLIASHEAVRTARSATALQEASGERQKAVSELTALATAELTAEGRPVAGTTRDRINSTLLAVAADPAGEEDLVAGRLVRDIEPSGGGWGDLGLTPSAPPDPGAKARTAAEKARAKADKLIREAEAAAQQVERAEKALADARARADTARAAATEATAEAAEAEAAASETQG